MTITKREILVCIPIACILICLGLFIDSRIIESSLLSNEEYTKTLKIDNDNDMFKYVIDTNVGKVINYGEFKVSDGVKDSWLKNDYMYIKKITEEYRRHHRTVCSGSGKTRSCHTQTYYTWDDVNSTINNVEKITFSSVDFLFTDFKKYPVYRLELSKDNVIDSLVNKIDDNCIYEDISWSHHVGDKRYYYRVINKSFYGTVFGEVKGNKFQDKDKLTIHDSNIEDFLKSKDGWSIATRVIYWIFYLIITGLAIYGYLYIDNDYLEE